LQIGKSTLRIGSTVPDLAGQGINSRTAESKAREPLGRQGDFLFVFNNLKFWILSFTSVYLEHVHRTQRHSAFLPNSRWLWNLCYPAATYHCPSSP